MRAVAGLRMEMMVTIVASLVLPAIAAFCVFGFMATFGTHGQASYVHDLSYRLCRCRRRLCCWNDCVDRDIGSQIEFCMMVPCPESVLDY